MSEANGNTLDSLGRPDLIDPNPRDVTPRWIAKCTDEELETLAYMWRDGGERWKMVKQEQARRSNDQADRTAKAGERIDS